ncbi:MAG: TolC family protein [Deltaproteobacteria bacterium]|nr:TolC family protein [Deltaproteobacteria bacterium]MBI3391091.1 TolC family protein [Deltaproteobacteria bacterium]
MRASWTRLLLAASAIIAPWGARALSAGEQLTLADALTRARTQPALRAAQAEVEAARARLAQAGLIQANPVITGDGAWHRTPPDTHVDSAITLGQEVEVGGQRGLRLSSGQYDVDRAEHLFADKSRTVDGEVRRAFFGLAATERRKALAAESATIAKRVLETTQRRARAGDVGDLEVQLAQIESTRAAQAVATAETDRARAVARFATAIGADAQESLVIAVADTTPAALPALPPEDTLVTQALDTRPDLAAARAERARLEAEARLTHRRALVPNPTIRGFYRHEQANEQIVGGEIEVPLPVWNRDQGTEAALYANARGASAEADRLAREIPRQIHLAVARRNAAADAWTRYERDTVPATNSARDLIERAYASGYLGLPDVLAQQDRLLQIRSAAIAAWLDLREAEADLIEAVGEEPK